MKRSGKTALALALALLLALSSLPVSALPAFEKGGAAPAWTVPSGYNAHDYTKCVEFLEQTDSSGVKNGTKLSSSYDPNDPETWGSDGWSDRSFTWIGVDGELRLMKLSVIGKQLAGALDVSNCPMLDSVVCWDNRITALDVTGCGALTELYARTNLIPALDLSDNPLLEILSCGENPLSELDVSANPALWYLYCYGTDVAEIDLANNRAIRHMNLSSNALTELDVTGCPELQIFYCLGNELTELDVSGNPHLFSLYCNDNSIAELDVSNHTELTILDCYGNGMTALNIAGCTVLNDVHCGINALTELDISACPNLEYLDCTNNLLTSLDLSQSPQLLKLSCIQNPMRQLDLTACPSMALKTVSAQGSGYIGYYCEVDYYTGATSLYVFGAPEAGESFEGFYDQDGELISAGAWYSQFNSYYHYFPVVPETLSNVVAHFSGSAATPGDADGNGSVSIADAVLTLRYTMGLVGEDALELANADIDGNGSVTVADAVTILRTAMGIA